MARLIVFGPSHYGERARWALDHAGLAYREERWAPGPHALLARRLAPATTTPILVPDEGAAIQGSDRILDHVGLEGGDRDLERRFERRIGPLVRRLVYAAVIEDPASGVRDALLDGVAARQRLVGRLAWPLTRRLIAIGFDARPALVPELCEALEGELAWFASALAARGERLAGDRFGRADLTAASLLAPFAIPPECPVRDLYERVRLPEALDARVRRWRGEPALAWVLRTYARHRRRDPAQEAG